MNNKRYVIFVAFAVAVMLTVTLLPHHHHNGKLCTEVEYCEEDERYNDEHTGHCGDKTSCVDKSVFIIAKRSVDLIDNGTNILPIFLLAGQIILCSYDTSKVSESWNLYRHTFYRSADLCPTNILRGPPSLYV